MKKDLKWLSRLEKMGADRDVASELRLAWKLLDDIAWRVSDSASSNWSGPDIIAAVADYYEDTVAGLIRRLEIENARDDEERTTS